MKIKLKDSNCVFDFVRWGEDAGYPRVAQCAVTTPVAKHIICFQEDEFDFISDTETEQQDLRCALACDIFSRIMTQNQSIDERMVKHVVKMVDVLFDELKEKEKRARR